MLILRVIGLSEAEKWGEQSQVHGILDAKSCRGPSSWLFQDQKDLYGWNVDSKVGGLKDELGQRRKSQTIKVILNHSKSVFIS